MFYSIQTVLNSVRSVRDFNLDADGRKLLDELAESRSDRALRLFQSESESLERLAATAKELGIPLTPKTAAQVFSVLKRMDRRAAARQRLLVQIAFTFLLLIVIAVLLASPGSSVAREKAAFGCIGVLLGYWFR